MFIFGTPLVKFLDPLLISPSKQALNRFNSLLLSLCKQIMYNNETTKPRLNSTFSYSSSKNEEKMLSLKFQSDVCRNCI
uniref:Putative ovule protein n=1 Tax=Solanum chacoense TaxID=4108 RepID=A0A0V0HHV1_SOLCH